MSSHHPPQELLMEYAAGTACEAVSVMVACHATYCAQCRHRVAELESAGAALLDQGSAPPVADLDRRIEDLLSRLDDAPPEAPATAKVYDPLIPAPLLEYSGPSEQIPWKRVFPGVFVHELKLLWGDVPVRLTRARAGLSIPTHTHEGYECDLILQGGLRDLTRGGDFERGDVQSADETVTHNLAVLEDEDCILVAFNEGRPQGRSVGAKLVYKYLGW